MPRSKSSGQPPPPPVAQRATKTPTAEIPLKLQEIAQGTLRFSRELTAGINRREIERMFEQEAKGALTVLTSQRVQQKDRDDGFMHYLELAGSFFVGLALKLSPGRRALFAASLLCPLLGLFFGTHIDLSWPFRISLDFLPFWFMASSAGLTLLLALELVDRLKVRDEVEVARQLQAELLPKRLPELPGYRVAHSYRTANEIGGDYYDFLPLDDGRVALAMGDASGHGISAGLLMAIANSSLKMAIELDPDPATVLGLLNRVLCRTGSKRQFMSLFYGVLDPRTGDLEYANAGHPFPLRRKASGEIEELGSGSLPLGIRRAVSFSSERTTLERGDFLVLYSDGLPEAIGGTQDEAFGFDRIKQALSHPHSPQQVHRRILDAIDGHLQHRPLADDLTLVVLDRAPFLPEIVD